MNVDPISSKFIDKQSKISTPKKTKEGNSYAKEKTNQKGLDKINFTPIPSNSEKLKQLKKTKAQKTLPSPLLSIQEKSSQTTSPKLEKTPHRILPKFQPKSFMTTPTPSPGHLNDFQGESVDAIIMGKRNQNNNSVAKNKSHSDPGVYSQSAKLIEKEISKVKQRKQFEIDEESQNIHSLLKTAHKTCLSTKIQTTLKETNIFKTAIPLEDLDINAKILAFPNEKTKQPAIQVLILDPSLGTKLGQGGYKKYYLGIDINSGVVGGVGLQRLSPESNSNRSLEQITKEMIKEHNLGMDIKNKVGSGIHTTKLVTLIKEHMSQEEFEASLGERDPEQKIEEVIHIERLALWAPLLKGNFCTFDPATAKGDDLIPITPKELYQKAKKLFALLDKLHKAGYAHCDIKLDNLFLNNKLEPLLGDWGKAETLKELNKGQFEVKCRGDNKKLALHLADLLTRLNESNKLPEKEYVKYEGKFVNLAAKYNVMIKKLNESRIYYQSENNPNPTSYWELDKKSK